MIISHRNDSPAMDIDSFTSILSSHHEYPRNGCWEMVKTATGNVNTAQAVSREAWSGRPTLLMALPGKM